MRHTRNHMLCDNCFSEMPPNAEKVVLTFFELFTAPGVLPGIQEVLKVVLFLINYHLPDT